MRWTMVMPVLCLPLTAQVSLADAIQAALSRHPRLKIEQERVTIARARTQQASAGFDSVVDARWQHSITHTPLTGLERFQVNSAGLGVSNQAANVTNGAFNVTRLRRDGIQISGSADLRRITDNLVQTQGVNLSRLRLQLNVPLLGGRGREAAAAEERATRIEAGASILELNHLAASMAADCAIRYWELAAADQTLQVFVRAEERGRTLVNNITTLIEAGRLPRAEIEQARANLAGRTVSRAAAEQRVVEAAQALALAMGRDTEEMTAGLHASDTLPDGAAAPQPEPRPEDWVARALAQRADYLVERELGNAFQARRAAAANDLKPRLDLQLATGFSGLDEGRRPDRLLVSPFTRIGGLDAVGGLSYSSPVGRRAAQARLQQAIAESRQNQLRAGDLARNIASSIVAGIGAFRNAVVRVRESQVQVAASQAALDGEREKLRLGVGSVVDLVTMEDRLTNARAAQVEAALQYAILLARLRFAAGAILDPRQSVQPVDGRLFYSPPWEETRP